MEYKLKINDEIVSADVANQGEDHLTAVIGEKSYAVDYAAIDSQWIHLTVNGQGVNAYVADQGDGKWITISGKSYFVQDADLLEQTRTRKKGPGVDPSDVTPPMPAVVISVTVAEGDVVAKGQTVVIVSAMKMETTLAAPFDGTVTKVNVAEGDKVMPGDILVDIEKAGPEVEGIPE